ncbi:hypothetical protein CR513_20819, partial [Mucuna pruriens]
MFEPGKNEDELRANLDMFQEVQVIAHVREYAVKARAARRYNRRSVLRNFKSQDLVLRKIMRTAESNKLMPIWEGPFRIFEEVGKRVYRLEHLDGKKIPCTWNAATLRMTQRLVGGRGTKTQRPVGGRVLELGPGHKDPKTRRRPSIETWSRAQRPIGSRVLKLGPGHEDPKTCRRLTIESWSTAQRPVGGRVLKLGLGHEDQRSIGNRLSKVGLGHKDP